MGGIYEYGLLLAPDASFKQCLSQKSILVKVKEIIQHNPLHGHFQVIPALTYVRKPNPLLPLNADIISTAPFFFSFPKGTGNIGLLVVLTGFQ